MKTNVFFFTIILFTLFLGACGTTQPMSTEQSIDLILSDYALPNGPGASVLVMDRDSVIFKKSYGLASVKEQIPVTTSTNFRLASVTKQFTAMSVLLLKEQGKLSLDDKILKFFPDFPLYGKDITVRNLLNHTSGLIDYEDFVPDTQTYQVLDADCLRLMFNAESLYFPAGTQYRYSNTGYALLALIVEQISGNHYAEFVNENIFVKAGMTTTVAFEHGSSTVVNRAYGYSFIGSMWTETDQSNTSAVLGDGGIYSNVEDMSRWITSLWHFNFIPELQQQQAWSDGVLNDGTPIPYGMGWHTETYRGINHPHHAGSTRGFRNHLLLFPQRKMMIIILTNRNQGTPITEAKKIADLFWESR
ncbi:MAG: beta-lactamase family protein [Bacteroidetes bacterium]|nr:beta-lactamase family protein [Bacteroidota bacterium]